MSRRFCFHVPLSRTLFGYVRHTCANLATIENSKEKRYVRIAYTRARLCVRMRAELRTASLPHIQRNSFSLPLTLQPSPRPTNQQQWRTAVSADSLKCTINLPRQEIGRPWGSDSHPLLRSTPCPPVRVYPSSDRFISYYSREKRAKTISADM